MTVLLPVMLIALTAGTNPLNEPASQRLPAAPSLRSVLVQPPAWRLPEPDFRRGPIARPDRFTARAAALRAPRPSVATKVGAGVVGALLGFYVGASVGGAIDCGRDCLTGALVGGSIGTAAGAAVGVMLVR